MAIALAAALALLTGCGYGSKAPTRYGAGAPGPAASGAELSAGTVRIGYFANLTHATALIGTWDGRFARALGGTRLRTQVFNAGPAEIEALNSGAIDIGWIGPAPAVNGWAKSGGQALRIISGATSGGAELVVNPARISDVADLRGKQVATPQLGNTQDVALLDFLSAHGFREDPRTGRGDVSVVRTDNALTPAAYAAGRLDAAWVPEPVASQLVAEGAKVLVDERSLWPDGAFVSTNVVVSPAFLRAHPDVVRAVLTASVETNAWIGAHPDEAKQQAGAALRALTGKALPPAVLERAWSAFTVTDDPLAATLRAQAAHAVTAGLLDPPDLAGIYDLAPLNQVLAAEHRPGVTAAGLGTQ
ncbi:ABC transporter substrate-binding protein [Kitasatospora sp. NBC_01287]|uniref:ABC transporter substrate-binding protein n=1 Tax=Kitasatospora sp. NBC_01287 TaxID=2903573 RepID=UPI002254A099|nr:ABC transporter substrate-binding protein [Kitasatospora sp. NBC_01287]MCX4746945.1 ABC transporter substrate-binding protein [Kitasatospora sp. NBC_01287]